MTFRLDVGQSIKKSINTNLSSTSHVTSTVLDALRLLRSSSASFILLSGVIKTCRSQEEGKVRGGETDQYFQ